MNRFYITLLAAVLLTSGCYTTGPATTVTRTAANEQIDLSGEWNDTDANQVSKFMIQDCLSRPWHSQFAAKQGRKPVVKLYPIKNRSSDHVQTKFFTKQVEMELVNSGVIKVVAALDETADARFEKMDQSRHASDKTAKQQQAETGSDFVLNGWVVSQNDAAGGTEVKAFVTTMELIEVETQEKVWIKVHQIKKVIQRAASEW